MLKVGLTGGYATGKSFVAAELQRLGCHLIFADKLGHLTLEQSGEGYRPTLELFGPEILQTNGQIDRKRLGAIVFRSPELLAQLNAIVHPAVFRLEEQMLSEFESTDPHGIAVVEAAILIETGRYAMFDKLLLTTCSPEIQVQRGIKRDGLTRDQVLERMERQLPVEEKRAFANYVIDTGGDKATTIEHVQQIFQELNRLAEAR